MRLLDGGGIVGFRHFFHVNAHLRLLGNGNDLRGGLPRDIGGANHHARSTLVLRQVVHDVLQHALAEMLAQAAGARAVLDGLVCDGLQRLAGVN